MMNNIQALILAAGKGKRINAQEKPKVLYPLLGKPIISYCLKSLKKTGFKKPILVIGYKGNEVKKTLGNSVGYVWQKRQLGTGHAVLCAKDALMGTKSVLIIYGDMPFWEAKTFKKLIREHQKTGATLSMVSVVLDNPSFYKYGHIIRDKNGNLKEIVEEKVATSEQKKIKECNPGCYVIETDWLFKNLPKIKKSAVGEYYLTDLLGLAVSQNEKINIVSTSDQNEVLGINTPEQLKLAESILEKHK
jgi:bifunctional UDP-N-acetylglucosamine pyrophosphorylase/glucosamine-1-phosphate N-acetyltransferase